MKTELLSNVFLSMETSANNLFKNFFLCFTRIRGLYKKILRQGVALKWRMKHLI